MFQAVLRRSLYSFFLCILCISQTATAAEPDTRSLKGWNYLHSLLIKAGVDPADATRIFRDSRMPAYDPLVFNARPAESHALYSHRNSPTERASALRFYARNREAFYQASETFHVPESVMLSILQIETHCGGFTGKARILPGIARLAAASDPQNLTHNIDFNRKVYGDKINAEEIKARGKWLTETFLPHVVASIQLARYAERDPLELRGSGSGAIGLPQFLPANVFSYGIDGNSDGKLDVFQEADAIFSVAHYLSMHGWKQRELDLKDQRAVIWNYNHSEPYIDTVLAMANEFEPPIAEARANNSVNGGQLLAIFVPNRIRN